MFLMSLHLRYPYGAERRRPNRAVFHDFVLSAKRDKGHVGVRVTVSEHLRRRRRAIRVVNFPSGGWMRAGFFFLCVFIV